jgi:hypothetical protein
LAAPFCFFYAFAGSFDRVFFIPKFLFADDTGMQQRRRDVERIH